MRTLKWLKKYFNKPPESLKEAFAASHFIALKQNVKDAMRFLRTTHLRSFFYRHKLPWYLILGAANTGKSTLLAMCGLNLVSTNKLPLQAVADTPYCQWGFGKEAVFIDASGNLLLPAHTDTTTLTLWEKFVTFLYRARLFRPMDGVILCIDLLDFENKSFQQRREYIDSLHHHLQSVIRPTPVYVIFTRCDRILGFTEFFHTLSSEERDQICGITLPLIEQQNFSAYIDEQLNSFLLRLNQQISVSLQRERNLEKRLRIKNFPLQLEAQKRTITQLNSQLHSTKNPIKGIYFTSSLQEGIQHDALANLVDIFELPHETNTSDRPLQNHPFFIKNTLQKISRTRESIPSPDNKQVLQKVINSPQFSLAFGSVFFAALLLMLGSYFYNRQAIVHVQSLLSDYQDYQQTTFQADPLSLLNTLYRGLISVEYASNPLVGLVFHQAGHLKNQLNTLYNQALDNTFAPKLEQTLLTQLQSEIKIKSPSLFNTLKVYLMLNDSEHRDVKFIDNWFETYTTLAFKGNKETSQMFMQHLHNLLTEKSFALKANKPLIASAQDTLRSLPPADLIYAGIEEKYRALAKTNIKTPTNVLYTAKNFPAIYKQDIAILTTQIIKNDAWVLGETLPNQLMRSLISQLTQDVQQLYVSRYAEFWLARLSNLTIPAFKNLNEARLFAHNLNTDRSLLIAPLNIIETNITPIAATPAGQKVLATLKETRDLLAKDKFNQDVTNALQNLVAYLDNILKSKHVATATLTATQKRMEIAEKDPISQLMAVSSQVQAPINSWLNLLAVNTWKVMLDTSQHTLNTLWTANVLPKYNSQILDHYPVFKNGLLETPLHEFGEFFGPGGTIETFFKQNLASFVDTSTLYWKWKQVDGLQLDIPQNTLEMFNRASLIRKMYFANNTKLPNIKFSLMPINIDLISNNFVLNIDGQMVSYTTDFRQAKSINWPGTKSNMAMLEIQQGDKKQILYEAKGEWAVFKLFAHAHLSTSSNPKLYQLEFNMGDKQISYELLADTPLNAFLPDILNGFRCPTGL